MIKRVYDGDAHTGMREQRYVVGTRKLDDARTVRLFGPVRPRGPAPDAQWLGFIERGIDFDGKGDDVESRETEAVRASGVLDGLVEWRENEFDRRLSFSIREDDIRQALRRLISTQANVD